MFGHGHYLNTQEKKAARVRTESTASVAPMADDYPHKYTEITIEYIVRGKGVAEEAVKRAVQLSMDKYCSVKATLEGSARVNFSYRIIEE